MGLKSTLARQGRKIKKLAKKPTAGQKQIETPVKEQRAYAKGQVKAAAATAGLAGLGIRELNKRLRENEKAMEDAKTAKERAELKAERAEIKAAVEKTLREMQSEGMQKGGMGLKKPTLDQKGLKKLPTEVRNKMGYMKRGGMMKSGNNDMRKGGMFYK